MPDVHMPHVTAPSLPNIHMPHVKMPEIHMPHITAPTLPTYHAPDLHMPDMKTRDIHMPNVTAPTIQIPKIYVPHIPHPEVHAERVKSWAHMAEDGLRKELHMAHVRLMALLHPQMDPQEASAEAQKKVQALEDEEGLRECLSETHQTIDRSLNIPVLAPDAVGLEQADMQKYNTLMQKLNHLHMQ